MMGSIHYLPGKKLLNLKFFNPRGEFSCLTSASTSAGGGRKTKMQNDKSIPNVTYVCDVCRFALCKRKHCFWNQYDHRNSYKSYDFVSLR